VSVSFAYSSCIAYKLLYFIISIRLWVYTRTLAVILTAIKSMIGTRNKQYTYFGTAYKRRPQSWGVCPMRTFCRQGGRRVQIRTSALFGANYFGFLKFMMCPYGQGGWVSAYKERKGSIFLDFVRTSFIDGPFSKLVRD